MKKIYTIGIVMLLVLGLAFAGINLSARNPIISINKDAKAQLDSMGLDNPETSELVCDVDICEFKMYKGEFKLGSHTFPARFCDTYEEVDNQTTGTCLHYTDYTDNELATMQDEMIVDKLEFYAGVFEARENKVEKTPTLGAGTVTVGEKK